MDCDSDVLATRVLVATFSPFLLLSRMRNPINLDASVRITVIVWTVLTPIVVGDDTEEDESNSVPPQKTPIFASESERADPP